MRDERDIVERLRKAPVATGTAMFNAHQLLEDAARQIEVLRMTNGMLRGQIRSLGEIPCVAENATVREDEYAMRRSARGN